MNALSMFGLLFAGALMAIAFIGLGVAISVKFGNISYERYQQGITDGWRAREARAKMNDVARTMKK